ncbi:MAG: hypothetical protein U0U25_04520 [Flavobacteriales bacterium]
MPVLLIAGLLTSCASLKTRTAHTADIQGPVVHTPVLADLEVAGTKATGQATASAGNSIEAVKNMAVAEALKATGADLLVEPTFETQKKSGKTIVSVTGFPAKYKNFRPARAEDIPLMDAGTRYLTTTAKSEVVPEKKKGPGGVIAALAGAALLVLIIAGR